eukprot:CAMPEP_0204621330 /NCGR_PEP_ID=MMETSP0717-20131115/7070_1 /ASSEMBLY_ACC=CAM_ASM_000666 /TAXON_ID=230516 /ORGANISM="Chaetoceros curvisetus" /LENGTH=300 /DNA_ID=CAMNT_0051635703 /DNA_START=207 /DNA_END=1109 /DNA_ORIENTATION=+
MGPTLIRTHAGTISTDDKQMPLGVPSNFLYLQAALNQFAKLKEDKRHFGEVFYSTLFKDFMTNKAEWLHFFRNLQNQGHAGDSTLILRELSCIYEGRKLWEECEAVLDFQDELLNILRKHNLSPNKLYDLSDLISNKEYQLLSNRYTLNNELGRYKENAYVLKELVRLEKKLLMPDEQHDSKLWNTSVKIYKYTVSDRLPSERIDQLSVDDVAKVLLHARKLTDRARLTCPKIGKLIDEAGRKPIDTKMDLLKCDYCSKEETFLGELKKCFKCKKVVYCNKDCQKKAWSRHKKACVKISK